jgi:ADP-heptose:LPS heptosyltransferase
MKKDALMIRKWAHGDVLMAEPIIRALKDKGYEKIYVTTQAKEMLANHPLIESINSSPPLEEVDVYNLDDTYERRIHLNLLIQDSYVLDTGLTLEEKDKVPQIFLTDDEIKYGQELLGEGKWMVLYLAYPNGPGARPHWAYKHWRPVVSHLKKRGFQICLIGHLHEKNIDCNLIDKDMRDKTTIREWLSIQARSDLFLGTEGSPIIVAQAFGTPGVAIFNKNVPASLFMNPDFHNMEIVLRLKGQKLRPQEIISLLDKVIASTL